MWPFGKSAEKRLEDALERYDFLRNANLDVAVENKTAVISGEVAGEAHKNVVVGTAQGINGIDHVDVTGLKVNEQAAGERAVPAPDRDPSALAKAAYQKIQGDQNLGDDPIDVLQSGSKVVLRGAVDSQAEFDKAKALAAGVPGVSAVDTGGLRVVQNVRQLASTNARGNVVYTVEPGDTLSEIALKYYGNGTREYYMKIAKANGLDNPDLIRVGQELEIPGTPAGPDEQLA